MITNFNPFPTLTTERLILRRLIMSDVKELSELRSDVSVNKYLNRPKTTTVEEAKDYVNKIDGFIAEEKSMYWVICLKNDTALIGTICIWNLVPESDMADIGYEMSPAYQGKGLMNEAVQKMIEFGFDWMQLKMLIGIAHPENEKSLNVLKRNGFVEDVDFNFVSKDDTEGDIVYYLLK